MSRKIAIFGFIQKITTIDKFHTKFSEIVKFHKDSSQSKKRQSFLREKYGVGVRLTNFLAFRSWGRQKKKQRAGGLINQPIRVRDISEFYYK